MAETENLQVYRLWTDKHGIIRLEYVSVYSTEIERLTRELERTKHESGFYSTLAEIDRLRAALEHYNVPRCGGNCPCGKCDPGRVAREALAAVSV